MIGAIIGDIAGSSVCNPCWHGCKGQILPSARDAQCCFEVWSGNENPSL